MSRATQNSKVLRSGAIGFVVGLATLGVVAHGSPAHSLISDTTSSVTALAGGQNATRSTRAQEAQQKPSPQPQQDPYAQPQQDPYAQPQQDPYWQSQQDPYAQPQYQQPQQQYVQPAPSQQPQSQAS
jgi:hypothetical protein